jgi:hypothetical protein
VTGLNSGPMLDATGMCFFPECKTYEDTKIQKDTNKHTAPMQIYIVHQVYTLVGSLGTRLMAKLSMEVA